MTERPTEALLRELADGLEPVRRVPRLRSVAGAALALGVAAAGIDAGIRGGPFPLVSAGLPSHEISFLATLAGLVLAAGGALLAGLAGAVPGRDRAERFGRGGAVAGVACAVAGGLGWALTAGTPEATIPLGSCLDCALHALALGLPPALLAGVFLGRALARRPFRLSAFAATGAVALGASFVHASCTDAGALHVALGHVAAPLALALALALPLAWLARRGARPHRG